MFAWKVSLIVAAPLAVLAVLVLSPSRSADAFIHEKIAGSVPGRRRRSPTAGPTRRVERQFIHPRASGHRLD